MCAITGKYNFEMGRGVDRRTIEAMTDVMSHRGPNDRGIYLKENIALGHRRLSILDLSTAGHQPMCNETGTVWVVFNGEIYRYKELRTRLEGLGHIFQSNTDTEVIVHAYEEYGVECVKHFDGMFAFGIWDERRRRLFLARDHFGIKPLYYFVGSQFLVFGSEIKALLEDKEVPRSVDLQALSNFLTLHYVPAPRTMFENIRKLPPGHILVAENGKISVQRYWELRKQPHACLGIAEAADLVYNRLEHSVAQRLQSDVPVGALLSGGLDSSAVVGLMTRLSRTRVPAFSVGYSADGADGFSEFYYARKAAKAFQSDYHEVVVTPEMFLDFLPMAVWYQDEPIGEPASIPLYFVCKRARDAGITVLLSGEGSDELFAGYNRHIGESASKYYSRLPGILQKAIGRLCSAMPRVTALRKAHRSMINPDFWGRYQSWHTVFTPDLKESLLALGGVAIDSFVDSFAGHQPPDRDLDNIDKLLWFDSQIWLPDDLLMKKDRMAMATGIEARVPFLDHEFAEMAFSIPSGLKVKGFGGKHVLKKSMERLLPPEIIHRKKVGFATPISRWMANDLRKPVTDILFRSGSADHGYFDRRVVRTLLDEHVTGRDNHERLLFPLVNFNLWYQAFFSGSVTQKYAAAARS
jgi:asparagine synthase (glutamine-hydrolysing)